MAHATYSFTPDKRLIERQVRLGAITREQYRAYLDTLEDVAAKAVRFEPLAPDASARGEEREA